VQFLLRHDKRKKFRYAALQSQFAKETLGEPVAFDSFIFYHQQKSYTRSSGAIRTLYHLGGLWRCAYLLLIIPPFIRNGVYHFIATHRYQWFGKLQACRIPSSEEKELFLDS
jgi:predicted DCC family thiol-disulfide oxidoreductase YuxK